MMIEIPTQLRTQCPACRHNVGRYLLPIGDEAQIKIGSYREFQIMRTKIWGIKKPRSVEQLNTYWAACDFVAEQVSDETIQKDRYAIDFDVKLELRHIKSFRIVNGVQFIEMDSISFDNMAHLVACGFFERAFPVLAKTVNMSVEELIAAVKSRMRKY